MSRAILSAALAVATLTLLAGCGSGDDSPATVTETVTGATSTDGESPPSSSGETSATEDGSPPSADVQAHGLTGFTSPTGNIGCYMDKKSVRCDIAKRDWDPPARPASCNETVDYGQGIRLSAGGAPEFVCAGDTALGGGDSLPYGQSIAAGLLRCESSESGMACRDTETGRGFTLSIQSYETF
jgi:Family of unknown function (DUF6636)